MSRRRYVRNLDSDREAAEIRETFTNKPAEWQQSLGWRWPKMIVEVGQCLSVMYRSDKWRKKGDFINYKHNSESEQRLYLEPDFGIEERGGGPLPLQGKTESVPQGMLPDKIAILALFMGIQCRLYRRRGGSLYLPNGDDGIYEFSVPRSKLAAGKTKDGTTFLCVYDKKGPLCFVFGVELDIEKDGIVG